MSLIYSDNDYDNDNDNVTESEHSLVNCTCAYIDFSLVTIFVIEAGEGGVSVGGAETPI